MLHLYASLFDTMLGDLCRPYEFADGKAWCVPATTTASSFFADAACVEPLVQVGDEAAPCAIVPQYALREAHVGACGETAFVAIHELGDPFSGVAYAINAGQCEPIGAIDGTRKLGPKVSFNTFAPLSLQ